LLADELTAAVRGWSSLDQWTVGVQLLRAADSIGANLAEGLGRGKGPDRERFVVIARGSACELERWIERAEARHLPCPPATAARAGEVSRMLNGLLKSWRRRA
jgi:four helix bundle protein